MNTKSRPQEGQQSPQQLPDSRAAKTEFVEIGGNPDFFYYDHMIFRALELEKQFESIDSFPGDLAVAHS